MFDFIPTPRNAQEAAFQSRIYERAKTLFQEYKVSYGGDKIGAYMTDYYAVTSPEGATYVINTERKTCECDCWIKHHYCKHLIACLLDQKRREEEADAAMVEACVAKIAAEQDACLLAEDMRLIAQLHREGKSYPTDH